MASLQDDPAVPLLAVFAGLLLFYWYRSNAVPALAATNAGSQAGSGKSCASRSPGSSPFTPTTPAQGGGKAILKSPYRVGGSYVGGAVPGSNSGAAGSGSQWQGASTGQSRGNNTPAPAPSYPSAPGNGNGAFYGNTRPTGVQG